VRPGGVERGEGCGGVGNPRPIYNGVTETDLGGRRGRGGTGRTWTETWTVFLLQHPSTTRWLELDCLPTLPILL